MKYELNGDDLAVLLVSLIGRRNNIHGLLKIENMSESYYDSYKQELCTVENLLNKFFPNSVERLQSVA